MNPVYEVSGVNGSVAQCGQIGADGSGPVRAMCSGVEGGGRGFEREGVQGCGVGVGEYVGDLGG